MTVGVFRNLLNCMQFYDFISLHFLRVVLVLIETMYQFIFIFLIREDFRNVIRCVSYILYYPEEINVLSVKHLVNVITFI